jgi:hypothetical protein
MSNADETFPQLTRQTIRAMALLDTPDARRFFNALDALGWMVVPQGPLPPNDERFPVAFNTRAKWPSWCNNEFSFAALQQPKRREKLRLVHKRADEEEPSA